MPRQRHRAPILTITDVSRLVFYRRGSPPENCGLARCGAQTAQGGGLCTRLTTSFFVASAGAGAALVGLLFVAISVNPGRNAGPSAPPERQAVAASAFTALINAFFFSLAALIAADSLGGIAITVSVISIIATLRLIGDLFPPRLSWRIYLRHAGFLAIGLLVYGLRLFNGFSISSMVMT